jgi:hypothetical protein
MIQDSEQFLRELKNDAVSYAELRIELLKLGSYERIGKVISVLSYGIILTALGFFLVLFLFLVLGFFLSSLFNSLTAGFSVVAASLKKKMGVVAFFRKQFRSYVLNVVIATLVANDKKNETTDEPNPAGEVAG